jgi:molybdate transport system substrate-binding protein
VLAASSLTESFGAIAEAFEAEHAGVDVELTFDASSALATQIAEGVPADVFASADTANLEKVTSVGLGAGATTVFAGNRLQIVVPRGNPAGIRSLADMAGGKRLALCAPEVPCGSYATQAFEQAGLERPDASHEENVRGVLTKVGLGEADAGLVYLTDVLTNPDVESIDLPPEHQVVATYPATALRDAGSPAAAAAFVAFLTGKDAQAILEGYGFAAPLVR